MSRKLRKRLFDLLPFGCLLKQHQSISTPTNLIPPHTLSGAILCGLKAAHASNEGNVNETRRHAYLASVVFFFALIGMSHNGYAAPYYWISDGDIPGQFSTPRLACDALIKWSKDAAESRNNKAYEFFFRAVPWTPVRPSNYEYQCAGGEYTQGTGGTTWYLSGRATFRIVRIGDNCPAGLNLNSKTYVCENPAISQSTKQMGKVSTPTCGAENQAKANLAIIGNNYRTEENMPVKANSPLSFARHYNSVTGLWSHTYSTHLAVDNGGANVTLVTASGKQHSFQLSGGEFRGEPDQLGSLVKSENYWTYKSPSNETQTFNTNGQLVQISQLNGTSQKLTYGPASNVTTVTVTDNFGNTLSFSQDKQYRPAEMHTPGLDTTFLYNTSGQLFRAEQVRNGQEESRSYLYEAPEKPNLLTGITDERGLRVATWAYDEQDRVILSERANGANKILISYNADGSSTVTNELGKKTTYRYQVIQGVKHIVAVEGEPSANCPASNSTFTYNDRGQVLTQTDAKGFVTTYTYNDRGLETTRTQASGTPQARTTTTTWHATFNLPLTVTEGGQVTTYTYDSQGRQTSRTQTAL